MEPTNKQLLHFAQTMGFYDFISFAKDIGVPYSIIQNYTSMYGKEPVHIIFMILYYWKSNTAYPTFTDLLHGLIRKDMTSERQHILCHVSALYIFSLFVQCLFCHYLGVFSRWQFYIISWWEVSLLKRLNLLLVSLYTVNNTMTIVYKNDFTVHVSFSLW